jgi:CRISPR-associated endonuclease/helicase Cas3
MEKVYYGHTLEDLSENQWQLLEDHLKNVAEKAGFFAETFNAKDWAYIAGIWHDIGKYSKGFQNRLRGGKRVDHSTAGAKHAFESLGDNGKVLAYIIAGHHAGLADGRSNDNSCLTKRIENNPPDYSACPEDILKTFRQLKLPFIPDRKRAGFQISFFIRMLFSSLVDADFLDTENFMDRKKASRRQGYPSLEDMSKKLMPHLKRLTEKASQNRINEHRSRILERCISFAKEEPGLFSLTAPTGSGKTLSSLAFAMSHALDHGLKRIIYVLPFTSIIEQNARVFRDIFGDDAVLEHHSNFDPKTFDQEEENPRSRLAAENWDAPLIVTTNVQFFESLFRRKTSRCRKLHNISGSVVILDEAQMLPAHLLKPCLETLRELTLNYKSTIVLCTATQPALSTSPHFKNGLDSVREILPDPISVYNEFKRVNTSHIGMISDEELAKRLSEHRQVLCIVNTRKHARLLFEKIRKTEGCFHLSALMCPEHRSEKIEEIRKALSDNKPCRVVSTQLVEAGVDFDFPAVYRAAAGIDSIAQAAGRCNREGKLTEKGNLFIFTPENGLPPGHFRQNAQIAETVMTRHSDPLSLPAVKDYFENLYWIKGDLLDEYRILDEFEQGLRKGDFPFRTVDKKFRIIENDQESLFVPWNEYAQKIVEEMRSPKNPYSAARKAQRFTVQIFPRVLAGLVAEGSVERIKDQFYVLISKALYDKDLGLCPDSKIFSDVESLIC